jgi:hypothetical protein
MSEWGYERGDEDDDDDGGNNDCNDGDDSRAHDDSRVLRYSLQFRTSSRIGNAEIARTQCQ